MIEYYQEDGAGSIFIANGIGPVLRWDGFASSFEEAGLSPPGTALTVTGSGVGAIVGEYFAFERFVDADNNVSNLSPISVSYTAQGSTGTITDATNASPIVITSANHGLVTGTTIKITGVGGNTSANDTWLVTRIDNDAFSLDDSHGTATYNGGGTWISGVSTISFGSVPLPTESKVSRRQILRNTDGQATTFYVDVDTTDLSSTTFSSTRTDTDLATQEAVPLLDSENNLFANRHDKPLTFFPYLAFHLDRMFQCGSVEYTRGSIKVTNGSATVYGAGTDWKSTMAGRFLYVTGATKIYEIASANETAQTLTLTEAYSGVTDKFAFYCVRPPQAYENLVVFSEAGLPQSWPATNGLSVQVTGDKFTGLITYGQFAYILKERHLFKLTFSEGPLTDGGVFQAATRGCINARCAVTTDDSIYLMDELGIYSFSDRQVEGLSDNIHSFFHPKTGATLLELKINWKRKKFFHASLDKQFETIRWFICMGSDRYPRHALCLDYREKKWWLESFPFAICGSCFGHMEGTPQVIFGGAASKVVAAWQGNLDLADSSLGTVRSTVSSADLFSLTDSAATFAATGLVGSTVAMIDGSGKGQQRIITAVSGQTISINLPWNIVPAEGDTYQIGGVHWTYRTGFMRFGEAETDEPRTLELSWEATEKPMTADLRFILDRIGNYDTQKVTRSSKDGGGIASKKDSRDLVIDLTFPDGMARQTIPGHREHHIRGRRYVQFELEGFSNDDPIVIYQWLFEGLDSSEGQG